MYVLTNSEYIPVYCSKDKFVLYNKAIKLITKTDPVPFWEFGDYKLGENGDIYCWGEGGFNHVDNEYIMGWCLTFWKITRVEEI